MSSIPENELKSALKIAKKTCKLWEANKYLDSKGYLVFGVESVSEFSPEYTFRYINTGETYDKIVCFSNGKYFISSWGDWYEMTERKLSKRKD